MQRRLKRFIPHGLGAQLALAFPLLSIVLTSTLAAFFERRAIAQIETQIGQGFADLAAQTSDKLERGMFERYREVALIAGRPVISLGAGSGGTTGAWRAMTAGSTRLPYNLYLDAYVC